MIPIPDRLTAALADRYRIERALGAGGMATVYLAEDLKHKRKVAVKVLKPELAAVLGAERFVQEITTTAALQHPHILPLFDSGTADGFLYYVMPYIEGETLRGKLDREHQLGVEEAVRIATEVADALDYAHRQGVIHRDIKPENILLHDGRPMVADFGIALAVSAAAGGRMTETGMSLGTPHYMSPEQATAEKEITGRSDVYSLASVLYEMLTGEPPHMGTSAQQIIMKIVTDTPRPVTELRKTVPAPVAAAVAQALEKLPADRFASAADFAAALHGRFATRVSTQPTGARVGPASARWRRIAYALGAVAILAMAVAAWALRGRRAPGDRPRVEFAFRPNLAADDRTVVDISRDGRRIAMALKDSSGVTRLVTRDLASTALRVVPGTEGARDPAFSPSGEWLAYFADRYLYKIPVEGGTSIRLADSVNGAPSWGDDGTILFARTRAGLWRVPDSGGVAEQLTTLDSTRHEFEHWYPQALPGGRAALFNNFSTPFAESRIEAIEYATRRRTVLVEGAVAARYVPSGHLLYVRDGAVFAAPFDVDELRLLGPAVPVLEDVAWTATDGLAGYAVSDDGTLVYLKGSDWSVPRRVVWTDRAGNEQPLLPETGLWAEPRLSPDGRWLAVTRVDQSYQIWLYDLTRRVLSQLTRSAGVSFAPVWMPDSRSLVFTQETPVYDLFRAPIDGTAPTLIRESEADKIASSVSPDATTVVYHQSEVVDRLLFAPIGTGDAVLVEPRPTSQRNGGFSPDGRWLVYEEFSQDQRPDVYVRALDGERGRRPVSADGGDQPRWTRGGREIIYRKGDAILSVSFDPATGEVGTPTRLFSRPNAGRLASNRTIGYDVTPDGARLVLVIPVDRPAAQPVVVVLNWLDELERKVPR
ncbi:MAG: protein kinase [Gemmatimonadales bacterium]